MALMAQSRHHTQEVDLAATLKALPPVRWAVQLYERITNISETNFQLGMEMVARGEFDEAIRRFRNVIKRRPNDAPAWYNLGCSYLARGLEQEAIDAFRHSLRLDGRNETARFLLASIQDGQFADDYVPHTTPPELVKNQFTTLALEYEAMELGERDYKGHQMMYEAAKSLLQPGQRFEHILDAGCGTGLCGELLRAFARQLTGVDVTPAMLVEAQHKTQDNGQMVYDELVRADLRDYLLTLPKPLFDCIVSANVMPIIGGLAAVMDGVQKGLKPGGYFIFSAYECEGRDYQLLPRRHVFAHSRAYIEAQAKRAGLVVKGMKAAPIYGKEPALMVLIQK
jgi:predicted TPR repeat methyltransferase